MRDSGSQMSHGCDLVLTFEVLLQAFFFCNVLDDSKCAFCTALFISQNVDGYSADIRFVVDGQPMFRGNDGLPAVQRVFEH